MACGKNIILASQSPRRFELMKMAGLQFEVRTKNVEEIHPEGVGVYDIPLSLAQKKAKALLPEIADNEVIIGADTIVILNGKIYEKPLDEQHAIAMLGELSGQMHEVVTGVCIVSNNKEVTFSETTRVFFNLLSKAQIEYYVKHYRPFDKAGSYACQEWIGAVAINRFEGDYFNVVGLPINRVYRELLQF